MGLFYSTLSYLKSFYSTPPPVIPLNETKINVSANKLIHTLRHKQIKIQKQAKNVQHNLLVTVNGMKNTRSIAGQQQLMQVIARKSQQVAAYQQIIQCANVIKNQAKILEIDSKKISQDCVLAICTIIYAYKQLQLNQCINLNDFVPQPHPIISKKQISEALREYVDYKQASFFAINTYVLQMCKRNQITLEKVNQVGHNFSYNPSKVVQKQSKSNQMFALSLQQLGIQQDFAVGYDKKFQQQMHE